MLHNSSISGIGEPVLAIEVINEKWMLLITVGINILLSCGKEYVKLAWEIIRFLTGEEKWNVQIDETILYVLKSSVS